MKRTTAVILFFLALGWFPKAIFAQSPLKFAAVEVSLWPEFDNPNMLVIYRLTLAPGVKLPAEIQLRIPVSAGTPNAVAARQPDGGLINLPYSQRNAGDWSSVVFKATTPEMQVEYYDPGLTKDGKARHFEYHWPGDYAVDGLTVEVQEPFDASQMRISPSLGMGKPGGDGLIYHTAQIGSLAAGQGFDIRIDYQKATDELSANRMSVEPSGALGDQALGRNNMMSLLPWIFGGLGFALLLGGGFWYWHSGRAREVELPRRSRRKPAEALDLEQESEEYIYCHACGKRAAPGDRFCRACGTQLRIPPG
jgi:hypothetical protein